MESHIRNIPNNKYSHTLTSVHHSTHYKQLKKIINNKNKPETTQTPNSRFKPIQELWQHLKNLGYINTLACA